MQMILYSYVENIRHIGQLNTILQIVYKYMFVYIRYICIYKVFIYDVQLFNLYIVFFILLFQFDLSWDTVTYGKTKDQLDMVAQARKLIKSIHNPIRSLVL